MLFAAACGEKPEAGRPQQGTAPATSAAPIDQRLGWFDSRCLAIDNRTLAADSPVAIVTLGDPPSVVDARIAGAATSGAMCPALLDDRRAANAGKGLSFYEVRLPPGVSAELGIGVIGDAARIGSGVDVSGDGVADRFTECATSEGVSFAVWSGMPYQGTALWSGYYYLGYDTEVTCPSK
jgi:hypothetical protein